MTYVFICIGSTKIVGDSLGPVTGSFLKDKYFNKNNIIIYGDLEEQIDFYNVDIIFDEINRKYNNDCIKIVIDSALGINVGNFNVSQGEISLGKGLNKSKIINGDVNIVGIVGKDHGDIFKNLIELKNSKELYINQMAKDIVKAIELY